MSSSQGRIGTFSAIDHEIVFGTGAPVAGAVHSLLFPSCHKNDLNLHKGIELLDPALPTTEQTSAMKAEENDDRPSFPEYSKVPPRWPLMGCLICGSNDDLSLLVLCDGCDGGEYHIYCMCPTLPSVPKGTFHCWPCVQREKRTRRLELEKRENRYSSRHLGSSSNAASSLSPVPPSRRAVACGTCARCTADDCRECDHCKDMKIYGGPGVKHQKCVNKICLSKVVPDLKPAREKREQEAAELFKVPMRTRGVIRPKTSMPAVSSTPSTTPKPSPSSLPPSPAPSASSDHGDMHVIEPDLYGRIVWTNPGGSSLSEEDVEEPPFPHSYYSSDSRPVNVPAKIPTASYLHLGTVPLVPAAPGAVFPPWDAPLAWPAEVLHPSDPRIPDHILEVYDRKFPLSRAKGARPNERYLCRLLGPVLQTSEELYEDEKDAPQWEEFIVMRSPDQVLTWEDGVAAGCVKIGLQFSGYVWATWEWTRPVFDAALVEAGHFGSSMLITNPAWEEDVMAMADERMKEKKARRENNSFTSSSNASDDDVSDSEELVRRPTVRSIPSIPYN